MKKIRVHSKFSQARRMHQAACKDFTDIQTIVAARCVGLSIGKRKFGMHPKIKPGLPCGD